MEQTAQTSVRHTVMHSITVLSFFILIHIVFEIRAVSRLLLSIADRHFWNTYFDLVFYGLFAVLLIVIQHRRLTQSLKEFVRNFIGYLRHIAMALVAAFVLIALSSVLLEYFAIGGNPNQAMLEKSSSIGPVTEGITIMLIGPFVEEMIFRDYIYEEVRIRLDGNRKGLICTWIVFTSLLFTLNHFSPEDFTDVRVMASYLVIFFEGLAMTALYEKDRNVISTLIFHVTMNSVAFLT